MYLQDVVHVYLCRPCSCHGSFYRPLAVLVSGWVLLFLAGGLIMPAGGNPTGGKGIPAAKGGIQPQAG